MTTRVDTGDLALVLESNPEPYLLAQSSLPGPRANLELAKAVAVTARPELIWRLARWGADRAPVNSAEEFLAFCGVVGLGRLAAQGDEAALEALRRAAVDPRWRIREAVAMAAQFIGRSSPERLVALLDDWIQGSFLARRAAVATVCEPDLLEVPLLAEHAWSLLDRAMRALMDAPDRTDHDLRVLRQGLGYCWSVAVAAHPEDGRARFEGWLDHPDVDVQWVLRENLGKKRLQRLDPDWVQALRERL
jgi:hypothetical protein